MVEAETEWLRAAGRGDRAAFDALVTASAPQLWGLVRRLTLDQATAEDVLQETFIGAWRSASSFTGAGSARSWLHGLARRHAARSWRRRAGQPTSATSLETLGELAGWGQDPEVAASRAEDRRLLLNAVAGLSEADRAVLGACDLEGRPAEEVARELGITSNAVGVRLHRARLRLMASLRLGGIDE